MRASPLNKVIEHLRGVLAQHETGGITDAELWKRYVHDRDEAAFESLVRRHGPMVFAVCRRVLHNAHDAEDAFQATFLVLVRRTSCLRSPARLGNWLYGVAYRTALHARAAALRRQAKEAAVIAPTTTTEDSWGELRTVLDQELQRLPEKYRAVLMLCDLEGRTREEVAREFGLPQGTVASRLARGRNLLAKRLSRHGASLSAAGLTAVLSRQTLASVPTSLMLSTLRAARAPLLGQAAGTPLVSLNVMTLLDGVLHAMWMTKLKTLAMLLLVLGLGLGTAVTAYQGGLVELTKPRPGIAPAEASPAPTAAMANAAPTKEEPGAVDVVGDPLPAKAVVRLGTERFRHGNPIWDLAFLDAKRILATDFREISIWDAATGRRLGQIGADSKTKWACLSADGRRLATRGFPGDTLDVWDVNSGVRLQRLVVDGSPSLSPDGTLVASCAKGTIHLWDIASGQELRSWQADVQTVYQFAFSPDGKVLVTGGQDKLIHVWEIVTGKELRSLRGHHDEIWSVGFSPDGRILTSVGCTVEEYKHPQGSQFVRRPTREVHVWDFPSGKEVRQVNVPSEENDWGISRLAFTHDGQILATLTNSGIRTWDIQSGKEIAAIVPTACCSLAFSPDNRILAAGGTHMIRIWDAASGQERQPSQGHQRAVRDVAVSPHGLLVATASEDGTVRLWEAETGNERQRFLVPTEAHAVAFSPDGHRLAAGGNGKTIYEWDVATGQLLHQYEGGPGPWSALAFSPDGQMLAYSRTDNTFSADGTLFLWNTKTGERVRSLRGAACQPFFSPEGKTVSAWAKNKVHVWNTASGIELRQFTAAYVAERCPIAFAPNGKWVACGQFDGSIPVYDMKTGEKLQQFQASPGGLGCLVFSPDSRTLVWGAPSGQLLLLEMASGQIRQRLTGHHGRINALVFWPDGTRLASASHDTTILIWDLLGTATCLAKKRSSRESRCVPAGRTSQASMVPRGMLRCANWLLLPRKRLPSWPRS